MNAWGFEHAFRAPLGPLGYASNDGRSLSYAGRFTVAGTAPVLPAEPYAAPPIGCIERVDAFDGWLWAYGLLASATDRDMLHAHERVLLADAMVRLEDVDGDYRVIRNAEVFAARFSLPEVWPWGELLP